MEKPSHEENYDFYEADGIGVYIRKDVKVINDSIHIFLRKILWIREVSVDGLSINC